VLTQKKLILLIMKNSVLHYQEASKSEH